MSDVAARRGWTAGLYSWLASLVGTEPDVALLAVGSHGRGDAAPHSDLDLVLLHRGRRDIKAVAERIWYPIWDRGLGLDHSVRTVREAVAVADGDLKAMLGLLDARLLAGDPALADELVATVREHWRNKARRWLPQLREAVAGRHERFGEVAYLLEPELKEGRGGLRDIHALRAASRATPVLAGRLEALDEPEACLVAVRTVLHGRTGKALDRLLLQEQDGVAADLGMGDADRLMAAVSAAARTVSYVGDDAWDRIDSWLAGPRGRRAAGDRPLGGGAVLRDGEVVITEPGSWLRAAVAAAELGVPLSRTSLARVAPEAPAPEVPWSDSWRQSLVGLLGSGAAAVPVLEALDQHGLLVRLIPEWEAVRHKPQRNAYHRFTVDRHLWEAAVQAAALTREVARPDLLLVGALLHDIGKGFPGDHTDAGVVVVSELAPRLGFSERDSNVLVDLVRHHLLLADVATRRDLDDPATIENVAAAVGDARTLELLGALTRADSLATGPAAWSEWKASLVDTLVQRTAAWLRGHRPPGANGETAEAAVMPLAPGAADGLHGDGNRCTAVGPDRPGLFSAVTGVLALHGLEVRSAAAGAAQDGRAVSVFEVEPSSGQPPRWDKVAADLDALLGGRLPLESRLSERARSYARRYRMTAAGPAGARVLVDNDASARATVVEVRAPDGVGVLHRIAAALAACGLDVRSAKVSTLGHEVVDAFYVVDADGAKVTDPEAVEAVRRAVLDRLAAP